MNVPWTRPDFGKEEADAVKRVMKRGWITQGEEVALFEVQLAQYLDARFVVCMSSGTMAMLASYLDLLNRIKVDRKYVDVLCSDSTFVASAMPAALLNLHLHFVDVNKKTLLVDINKLKSAFNAQPHMNRIATVVHLAGNVVDLDRLAKMDAHMIQDCCQAFGSQWRKRKVGSDCNYGVFSFHAAKLISTGEGGCVATNDVSIYESLKSMRNHCLMGKTYFSHGLGLNARMTDIQGAIGKVQLKKADRYIEHRFELADIYKNELRRVKKLSLIEFDKNVTRRSYGLFPIIGKRSQFISDLYGFLSTKGIDTRQFFFPLSDHRCLKREETYERIDSNNSNELMQTTILLPMGNKITKDEVYYVCKKIKEFVK